MYSYRFKMSEFVIGVSTPDPLSLEPPYSLFLCDEEKADITYTFEFTPSFPEPTGRFITNMWNSEIFDSGDSVSFFYNDVPPDKYYACRIVNKNDLFHQSVVIPDKYTGKLWTRVVFNLIGIEDVSALFSSAVLHSSYIDIGGEAVLFTAPCQTGKSTQADLWHKFRGAEIINGDKSLLSVNNGVCYAHGIPYSGSSGICKNRSLKVKAIVRLGQAPENTIRKLNGFEAYKAIFEGCYQSAWNAELSNNVSAVAEKIVNSTPVFHLDCVPDETAVEALESALI